VIHSTSSREATSTTPNKQLASITTSSPRTSFQPPAKKPKFSNTIIILSQGTGNCSPSSSARVPGPRASYILYRRIARADYQISPQQAPTLGSRVILNITTTPALLWFQSSFNRHNSATRSKSQNPKMASRSFKPASYLASAPSQSPRQRPAFTRTSSGSSTLSTASEDSFTNTLRGLCKNDSKQKENDDPGKSNL
jgi:hypothetical protein